MLILARKVGEEIVIGDDIVITVWSLHPSRVFLGVTAPLNVTIHRKEVYEKIKEKERDTDSD